MIIEIVVVLLTACSKNLGTYVQGTESLIPVEKKNILWLSANCYVVFLHRKITKYKKHRNVEM
jgi:membrane protein YdbS with pleckstrin-like domain